VQIGTSSARVSPLQSIRQPLFASLPGGRPSAAAAGGGPQNVQNCTAVGGAAGADVAQARWQAAAHLEGRMDWQELLHTALRATLVYLFVLFVLRVLGKRSVGNLSAFDLLVALMIGEVTDEIIFGDVTLAKGGVAVGVIAFWHYANAWATFRSKTLDKLLEGTPRRLVEHGRIDRDALAAERMSEDELWSSLRTQGIDDITEVKKACLEPSGQVSVVKEEWAEPLQKGDLERRAAKAA
jgi:uncharacterized membrane protein YcaP (DUF421 family)